MADADAVLDALGNGTRREILARLGAGPLPVGRLAAGLPVSRPAVSQHLRILERAGLVQGVPQGRQHVYALQPDGFQAARAWLDRFWREGLARFAALADER